MTNKDLKQGELYTINNSPFIWIKVSDTKSIYASESDNCLTNNSMECTVHRKTVDELLDKLQKEFGNQAAPSLGNMIPMKEMKNGQWFIGGYDISPKSGIYIKLADCYIKLLGSPNHYDKNGSSGELTNSSYTPISRLQYLRAHRPFNTVAKTQIESSNEVIKTTLKDAPSGSKKVELKLQPNSRLFYFVKDKGIKRIYQEDNGRYRMTWRDGQPVLNTEDSLGHKLQPYNNVKFIEHNDYILYKDGKITSMELGSRIAPLDIRDKTELTKYSETASKNVEIYPVSDRLKFSDIHVGELYSICGENSGLMWLKTSDTYSVFLSTEPHHLDMSHGVSCIGMTDHVWRVSRDYFIKSLEDLKKCPKLPAGPLSSFKVGDILHGHAYATSTYFVKIDDNKFISIFDKEADKFTKGFIVETTGTCNPFYPVNRLPEKSIVEQPTEEPKVATLPAIKFNQIKVGQLFTWSNYTDGGPDQNDIYLKVNDTQGLMLNFACEGNRLEWTVREDYCWPVSKEYFQKQLKKLESQPKQPAAYLESFCKGDVLQGENRQLYYVKTGDKEFRHIYATYGSGNGDFIVERGPRQACNTTLPFCLAHRDDGTVDRTRVRSHDDKKEIAAKPNRSKWAIFRILG